MNKNTAFPWYDALWLACYWQAYETVRQHYPNRLAEFVEAFNMLHTSDGYTVETLKQVLSHDRITQLKLLIKSLANDQLEKQELLSFGRFVVHEHPLFSEIHQEITPLVSRLAGQHLIPSYSFLSLYNNLGVCDLHLDAPNAKWTLDICIDQSDEWPIFISRPQPWPKPFQFGEQWQQSLKSEVEFQEYIMQPGEAVLFSGSSQWHYRERIPKKHAQNYCHLLFLHFVPVSAVDIVKPDNWATIFNMPKLSSIKLSGQTAEYEFSVKR